MKVRGLKRKKLFLGVISGIVLIYFIASLLAVMGTLPFIRPLWNTNRYFRFSMRADVSQRIVGLHQDDIIYMLGNPDPPHPHYGGPYVWIYSTGQSWAWAGAIIIFFNEDGIAERTVVSNPIHILGG